MDDDSIRTTKMQRVVVRLDRPIGPRNLFLLEPKVKEVIEDLGGDISKMQFKALEDGLEIIKLED